MQLPLVSMCDYPPPEGRTIAYENGRGFLPLPAGGERSDRAAMRSIVDVIRVRGRPRKQRGIYNPRHAMTFFHWLRSCRAAPSPGATRRPLPASGARLRDAAPVRFICDGAAPPGEGKKEKRQSRALDARALPSPAA
jgi:hypothetical protein